MSEHQAFRKIFKTLVLKIQETSSRDTTDIAIGDFIKELAVSCISADVDVANLFKDFSLDVGLVDKDIFYVGNDFSLEKYKKDTENAMNKPFLEWQKKHNYKKQKQEQMRKESDIADFLDKRMDYYKN